MATTLTACPKLPSVQNHLRTALRRTQAAITICGTMEPDSRIGTSQATRAGAPTALIIHVRTVFGLIRRSPSLVRTLAARIRKKFLGTSRQASSGMSLQTLASSSLAMMAYSWSTGALLWPGKVVLLISEERKHSRLQGAWSPPWSGPGHFVGLRQGCLGLAGDA